MTQDIQKENISFQLNSNLNSNSNLIKLQNKEDTNVKIRSIKNNRPSIDLEGVELHLTPPIIVGGTDGSGTRGVVALLLSSGVSMLSDGEGGDGGCQYDVHGKELHHQG